MTYTQDEIVLQVEKHAQICALFPLQDNTTTIEIFFKIQRDK